MIHVDEFIEFGTRNDEPMEVYARWFLHHKRLPAILIFDFEEFTKGLKLFCYMGSNQYRVTGASRLGDVWLHKDFTKDHGYTERVSIDDCSRWSKEEE